MPQRTNWFQDLITKIEQTLAPHGASVAASKMLTDSVTGKQREVDAVIEMDGNNGRIVKIGIECVDHSRKADVTWIESIAQKHAHLPIDRTVAVSKLGFTEAALEKAQFFHIDALSLKQAEAASWTQMLLTHFSFVSAYLEVIGVSFIAGGSQWALNEFTLAVGNDHLKDAMLYLSNGTEFHTINEELIVVETNREIAKAFSNHSIEDTQRVTIEHRLPEGTYLIDNDGTQHTITQFNIVVIFHKKTVEIPMQLSRYGEAQVHHGEAEFNGESIKIVSSELEGKNPQINVYIDTKKSQKGKPQKERKVQG